MAEETLIQTEEPIQKVEEKVSINPFDDSNWGNAPIEPKTDTNKPETVAPTETKPDDSDTVDADEYLNKQTGFSTWDEAKAAKAELDELKKNAKTPTEIKFANEASEKYFEALKAGKEDDVYDYLDKKKRIERLEKMEITKPSEAAEIIKEELRFKYKDLTPDQIERQFNRKFPIPKEPKQTLDQTEEEYNEALAEWKDKVKDIEMDMMIEAKMVKPEFSKFKSELVLPDIPKPTEPQQKQLTPEELEANKKYVDGFIQAVDNDVKNFQGFNVTFKDEAVEIPITYTLTDEQKTFLNGKMKEFATNNFDANYLFADRWLNKDGSVNVNQMTEDLSRVIYGKEMAQKFVNDSASKRLAHQIKLKSNINVSGNSSETNLQPEKPLREKEVDHLWQNG